MKLFRWSGLIGFILFSAIVLVIGFFFLDGWVKKSIEVAGMKLNGSEVNVGSVDMTLNPLGFDISNVEISDSEKLSHNTLELGEVKVAVNLPQLFLGNVRIFDMSVTGLQTDVERKKVAKLKPAEETSTETAKENIAKQVVTQKVTQLGEALPSKSSVVEQHTANTQSAVSDAKQTFENSKADLKLAADKLPSQTDVADYESRIAALKKAEVNSLEDLQALQSNIKNLKASVSADSAAVKSVEATLKNTVAVNKQALNDMVAAPGKDWSSIQEAYPLGKEGAIKVAQLLLGDGFFDKIEKAKYWYGKAKPWLARLKKEDDEVKPERGEGVFVKFDHSNPTANFQLDEGLMSFMSDGWPWQLSVQNITSSDGKGIKPVTFEILRGEAEAEALKIEGVLNTIDGQSVDTFTLFGRGVRFADRNLTLAGSDISWKPEAANVTGEVVSTDGKLNGQVVVKFPSNEFAVSGGSKTQKVLQSAFAQINTFDVTIGVTGTALKPKLSVQSDLDNQLSSAIRDIVTAEYQAWLKSVKAELTSKVASLTQSAEDAYHSVSAQEQSIDARIAEFKQSVEDEIDALEQKVEEQKAKLEKEIAAKKKAAEDAAKKEAEDALKGQADKLKDKLKF